MQNEDILRSNQKLVIELLRKKDINRLKDFINGLEIPFHLLNSNNFDLLIMAISFNCSPDIVELIYNKCNYKTLNYVVKDLNHLYEMSYMKNINYSNYSNESKDLKALNNVNKHLKSPLLLSLENSNFKSSKYLINKGADIYYKINGKHILEILREEDLLTMKKLNFLLENGFTLKKFDIQKLSNFKFKYIKRCLESYVFDTNFIKNILNLYKNGTHISKRNFNHIIKSEQNKIEIPRNMYLKYLDKKKYREVEYLFKYYDQNKATRFVNFILFYLNYFDRNYNKKPFYDFFDFIINNDTILPFSKEYAIKEIETIIENKKIKIVELIKSNNTTKLEAFLKKNNYILNYLYSNKDEILKLIDQLKASSYVIYILQKHFLF